MKWLIISVVVVAVAVLAWITLQDVRQLDPRAAVGQARLVAYGHVVSSPRPHAVIDEIWKGSNLSYPVHVGMIVPVPVTDGTFDHVLLCFAPRMFSHLLSPSAIFPVRGDGVGSPSVPLEELKALCSATPST